MCLNSNILQLVLSRGDIYFEAKDGKSLIILEYVGNKIKIGI